MGEAQAEPCVPLGGAVTLLGTQPLGEQSITSLWNSSVPSQRVSGPPPMASCRRELPQTFEVPFLPEADGSGKLVTRRPSVRLTRLNK